MIILKNKSEIKKIREAAVIVAEVLDLLKRFVEPGVTTKKLDSLAYEECLERNVKPAFKGYGGFPSSLCTSVNHQVVHGIPSDTILMDGDIISLDFGVFKNGYYGDAAITCAVGEISSEALRLLKVTEESLYKGIEMAVAGNKLFDISFAVQDHCEKNGFSVVRDFVGHGIGKNLHEDPQVPNYGTKGTGVPLRSGMVLAIEPMINAGGFAVDVLEDGWTVQTKDLSLSAHFEHTVAITDNGPDILTKLG